MTDQCGALLDDDGLYVLTCGRSGPHGIHYPGRWREATEQERRVISKLDRRHRGRPDYPAEAAPRRPSRPGRR